MNDKASVERRRAQADTGWGGAGVGGLPGGKRRGSGEHGGEGAVYPGVSEEGAASGGGVMNRNDTRGVRQIRGG